MNNALLAFFLALKPPPPTAPNYIIALSNLISAGLYGWFFLTVFVQRGTGAITSANIPFKVIVEKFVFASAASVMVIFSGLYFGKPDMTPKPPMLAFYFSALFLLFLAITHIKDIRRMIRARFKRTEAPLDSAIPLAQSKAIEKLNKRLSVEKQKELEQLVYEEDAYNRTRILNVGITLFYSLIVTFLLAVAEEILKRF